MALPTIMVAPNGAYLSKADHPALPVSLPEICKTAAACFAAGATGLHLHIRDKNGKHLLDAGRYNEALTELKTHVPDMAIQITSEAAGVYQPDIQRKVVLTCQAKFASVSIKEMVRESNASLTRNFYLDCDNSGIAVQHIIYDPSELDTLVNTLEPRLFQDNTLQLLFVLGRYGLFGASGPSALTPFLARMQQLGLHPDWAVCAFGQQETSCLLAAHNQGGKLRVGFENSRQNLDGATAKSNEQRVREVVSLT